MNAALLASAVVLALASPSQAAPAPFSVRVSGQGRDVLLLPGLACSAEVWGGVVAHLAKAHRVHAFTLAGFAGQPRVAAPMLRAVREGLERYVREQHLVRPVVVGHSLGATLALALAAGQGDGIGGVVAVDGVPFLPALFDPAATAESARPQAEALRARLSALTRAQYAAQSRMAAASMVKSPADAERIAGWGAQSDPAAVADAMFELMTTDLRPLLAQVTAPVLQLAAADFARDEAGRAGLRARYEAQLAKAPRHRVVLATQARHFIMLDDLPFLLAQLDAFLAAVRP